MGILRANIRLRNDSLSNWESLNPILLNGELGYDVESKLLKIGDGVTPWRDLKSVNSTSSINPSPTPSPGTFRNLIKADINYLTADGFDYGNNATNVLDGIFDNVASTRWIRLNPSSAYLKLFFKQSLFINQVTILNESRGASLNNTGFNIIVLEDLEGNILLTKTGSASYTPWVLDFPSTYVNGITIKPRNTFSSAVSVEISSLSAIVAPSV